MHSPLIISCALAARLLFMIPLISQGYSAPSTTNVQDGDTFLAIADSAGIPVESLEAANPGVAASDLYVGQVINIPTANEPATAMPVSNPASEAATATAPTTLITSASPPASSNPLPSRSSSAAPSKSVSGPSSAASSPTTTQDSSAASSSPATTTTPATTSSSASATTSSSAPPPPSTTAPPPPPSSAPPSTTSSTPNSPPAPVSCAPSPTGRYHDAKDVQDKTDSFCKDKSGVQLSDVQSGTVVDGSDQKGNHDDGSSNNEAGYNMTITALPDCTLPDANVLYPLPGATEFNCTQLLYNAWETCYSNDGMGGSIAAGCLVYTFHADP